MSENDKDKNVYHFNDLVGISFAVVVFALVMFAFGWMAGYANGVDGGKLLMLQSLEKWMDFHVVPNQEKKQ